MRNYIGHYITKSFMLVTGLLLVSASVWAHHGQGLSYDMDNIWTTWATVTEFNYANPHPSIKFDRTVSTGEVEHWVAEVANNPSRLARSGWSKRRSDEALAPGTRVKIYIASSRRGGFSGVVEKIEDEQGENVANTSEPIPEAVDLDGVPGGYNPAANN